MRLVKQWLAVESGPIEDYTDRFLVRYCVERHRARTPLIGATTLRQAAPKRQS